MVTQELPEVLLDMRGVTTTFTTRRGEVKAVDSLDLTVRRGEIIGIVGESGCGKSTVLRTVMGLIASPGRISSGQILYRGEDLLQHRPRDLRQIRGRSIAMIFQDPLSALNPVIRVGRQILEVLGLHGIYGSKGWRRLLDRRGRLAQRARVVDVMREVGIPAAGERYSAFPHEFSGGMQQRALIAMGLVGEAKLLLADEPTTALDVTIQAQIVELMKIINREHGTTIILVTHDLGLAAEFCDKIAVMYAGRVVEEGSAEEVVANPKHPYTQGLLGCLPQVAKGTLRSIPGNVPDLFGLGPGCAFADRCPNVAAVCRTERPPRVEVGPSWYSYCHFPDGASE